MKDIRIGVSVSDPGGTPLDKLVERVAAAEAAGFATAWIPNIFSSDALTVAALAGTATERIEIGTAVVPTFTRHPYYMAQQAQTTQAATRGRFVLGLGPSHKVVIEDILGLSYARPARHVREYLSVLGPLLAAGQVDFQGEVYRVKASLNVAVEKPPPVLIGALGPLMRRVAGSLCDGTITWMTGPKTLEAEVVPGVAAAAREAGRPAPRVVAGIPTVLTDDAAGAREKAAQLFSLYGRLPSYRAMLDAEGVSGPGDLVVAGDERALEEQIGRFASAGASDFQAAIFPHGDDSGAVMARTHAFLGELAGR